MARHTIKLQFYKANSITLNVDRKYKSRQFQKKLVCMCWGGRKYILESWQYGIFILQMRRPSLWNLSTCHSLQKGEPGPTPSSRDCSARSHYSCYFHRRSPEVRLPHPKFPSLSHKTAVNPGNQPVLVCLNLKADVYLYS